MRHFVPRADKKDKMGADAPGGLQTARLFVNGRSQAVRLPKEYQFHGENVYVKKVGEAVLLVPFDKDWEVFMNGLNSFSDDFMAAGRLQGNDQEREDYNVYA